MTMTIESTAAKTGRSMKKWANFIGRAPPPPPPAPRRRGRSPLALVAGSGRRRRRRGRVRRRASSRVAAASRLVGGTIDSIGDLGRLHLRPGRACTMPVDDDARRPAVNPSDRAELPNCAPSSTGVDA